MFDQAALGLSVLIACEPTVASPSPTPRLFPSATASSPTFPTVRSEGNSVSGVVFDPQGDPLPGASVRIQATTAAQPWHAIPALSSSPPRSLGRLPSRCGCSSAAPSSS
jgi:hypothetical protein